MKTFCKDTLKSPTFWAGVGILTLGGTPFGFAAATFLAMGWGLSALCEGTAELGGSMAEKATRGWRRSEPLPPEPPAPPPSLPPPPPPPPSKEDLMRQALEEYEEGKRLADMIPDPDLREKAHADVERKFRERQARIFR